MIKLKALSAVAVLPFALSGCYTPSFDAWEITNVELVAGFDFEDPPPCREVLGSIADVGYLGLITWGDGGPPIQPVGGDWFDDSSQYRGYLLNQTGADAYRCAFAEVTVERNTNVVPDKEWEVGHFVQLFVMAQHLCGNSHPDEDRRQPLAYAQVITQPGQNRVVFRKVIVASSCGIGPYTDNFSVGFPVNFAQWPSNDVMGALHEMQPVSALDCTFIVGFDIFQGCP